MTSDQISSLIDTSNWKYLRDASEFGSGRYAYLFKRGSYNLTMDVGYYTTVHGLGQSPTDVQISGNVQALATRTDGLALNNFWRGVENLTVIPSSNLRWDGSKDNTMIWAVSQATFLRRVSVKGRLLLFDFRYQTNFASGGFVADCVVDDTGTGTQDPANNKAVASGSQQQFLTRNTRWQGGVWNMVFVGDEQTPDGTWPNQPYTIVPTTPVIREKPYLTIDGSGNYVVQVPALKKSVAGTSWYEPDNLDSVDPIPISDFYIAKADNDTADTADTLDAALSQNKHLLLTPGIYNLSASLNAQNAGTIILGLGMATLRPTIGTSAITIADVDGVTVAGLIFDAGPQQKSPLLVVGAEVSSVDHSTNPTALFDLSCRVGGASVGSAQTCFVINSNDVIMDNIWLWRADHGKTGTVGWSDNPAETGLIVNGNKVIAYGLFVEHFQGFQTVWNGDNGQVYFYQSELPYDPPNQASWQQGTGQSAKNGFASYKVSESVQNHTAQGLGVYCFFRDAIVWCENAIETPEPTTGTEIQMSHMVTQWLDGKQGSGISHVINGRGATVGQPDNRKSTLPN